MDIDLKILIILQLEMFSGEAEKKMLYTSCCDSYSMNIDLALFDSLLLSVATYSSETQTFKGK